MANNPQKSPKAKVFETVAKQAKAAPKAAKVKTVTKNTEETNEAPLEGEPTDRRQTIHKSPGAVFDGRQTRSPLSL